MDESSREQDELGFNPERMLAGEESAKAGRIRTLAEAIRELRAKPWR